MRLSWTLSNALPPWMPVSPGPWSLKRSNGRLPGDQLRTVRNLSGSSPWLRVGALRVLRYGLPSISRLTCGTRLARWNVGTGAARPLDHRDPDHPYLPPDSDTGEAAPGELARAFALAILGACSIRAVKESAERSSLRNCFSSNGRRRGERLQRRAIDDLGSRDAHVVASFDRLDEREQRGSRSCQSTRSSSTRLAWITHCAGVRPSIGTR